MSYLPTYLPTYLPKDMDDDGVGKPFQLNFRVPWRGDSGMSDDVSLHSFDNVQRELNHLNVDIR